MNNKRNNLSPEKTIDLIELLKKIYSQRKILFYSVICSGIIGIFYSLSLNNQFKSSSTFYPHYENLDKSNNNLQNLAGLAGINIETNLSDDIPPSLYPQLIKSNDFKRRLLKVNLGNNITYKQHLLNYKPNISLQDIILLPIDLIKKIIQKKNNKSINKGNPNLNYLSEIENKLFKIIENNIEIELNNKDGFIKLSVVDTNPEISAIIALKANHFLQESIINFKIKNINEVYNFTSNQLDIAKKELYRIQDSLAYFRDSNINIRSDLFKNKLNRLETEYNLSKNLYNELAITKEKTAIDVQRNTPIFTIINNVVVPNEKFSPRRSIIVILFVFLGLFISTSYVLLKDNFKEYYKEIVN